jgi:hypothetical protein
MRAPCATYAPYEDMGNHVSPFEVAVDAAHRRIYSTSLANRTLAVFDADTHAVLGMYPIRELAQVRPDVVADATGAVWVLGESTPAVVRFDHDGGGRRQYPQPLSLANQGLPLPEGGLLVLGSDSEGITTLQRFEADGSIGAGTPLEDHAHGLIALHDGRYGLLMRDWQRLGMQVLDPDSLEPIDHCALPFEAYRGAQLDDGSVVLSSETAIGLAGCGGSNPAAWDVGVENKDVVSLGDVALVLDRVGSGEGVDPNLGWAWAVDGGGLLAERGFPTAKNTGYGALDPHTGLLWVNSEGSAELVAYDPASGPERARIRTGTFLDGLALDGSAPNGIILSGRLSNTLLRLELGSVVAESDAVRWPFSPVVDLDRDLVWVLSQTEATVHGLQRSDLSAMRLIDPGLEPNPLLCFGSLAMHPSRGTLLLAESHEDVLLELDPDNLTTQRRWELGGPPITDPDLIGRLELQVASDGAVLLVRTVDGRVQRLEPEGELLTSWLEAADLSTATAGDEVGITHYLADSDLLYVAGVALDPLSLERRPERDLPVSHLLGPHPWDQDNLLGVSSDVKSLVELSRSGEVLASQGFTDRELNAPSFAILPAQEAIMVVQSKDARACWFDFDRLRD